MADLLKSANYEIPTLKKGQEVEGKVVIATQNEILLDIGAKSEGIIAGRELTAAKDLVRSLSIGDNVEATVLYPENDAGQVVLTLRKLSGEKRWHELEEKKKNSEMLDVTVMEANRGGLICDFVGLRGFLPASQLLSMPSKLDDLVNKGVSVSVIEVDRQTNRIIFSQKKLGKKDLGTLIKGLAKVKIGEKYKGSVTAVLPFGIFVEIDLGKEDSEDKDGSEGNAGKKKSSESSISSKSSKIEGLVHISEISWEKVDDLVKLFKVGEKVDVIVIAKDTTTGRLNLSIKQLSEDPFVEASSKYAKEQKVSGNVSKVTPYGVYINIEEGVEGFIHISKVFPDASYNVGDLVEGEIESIDTNARKITIVPIAKEKPILYR
jgi:small subunit ribosomal protein S1